jgi:hypothetical protein
MKSLSKLTQVVHVREKNCLGLRLDAVAPAYNLVYLGGRDWENHGSRPSRAKILQDPISTSGWVWWYIPVIPATRETQVGRSLSRLARRTKQDSI